MISFISSKVLRLASTTRTLVLGGNSMRGELISEVSCCRKRALSPSSVICPIDIRNFTFVEVWMKARDNMYARRCMYLITRKMYVLIKRKKEAFYITKI